MIEIIKNEILLYYFCVHDIKKKEKLKKTKEII